MKVVCTLHSHIHTNTHTHTRDMYVYVCNKWVNYVWLAVEMRKRRISPRTGHEGPEVKSNRSTLSLTSAINGGGCSTPRPGCFIPPKETWYPLYRRLCGPQGRSGRVQKISSSTGMWSFDRPARSVSLYCETYTEYWPENLRERDHLQDLDVDGRIILKCV
jgi:hypothetical protein